MANPLTLPNNPFAQPAPADPTLDPRAIVFAHQPGDAVPNFANIAPATQGPSIGASWMADLPPPPPVQAPAAAPPPGPIPSVDPTANFRPAPVAPAVPRAPAANPDTGIVQAGDKTAQAITAEGQAAKDAADAEAQARHEGQAQLEEQQKQLREQQVQRDQAVRQLNEDTKAAYEKAHTTVIPDFWKDQKGQAVGAAVLVGLGAVGQGLTAFGTGANVGNGAQQIINHAVDSYYERKKQEIDNLYRYADAKGKLNDQQKLDWATKLNDLQYQIAFTHQSIQDHIAEVAAQGKGKIDQTHFAALAAENGERTQQQLQAAQLQRAQINHLRNEDSIGFMNAKTARLTAENKANAVTDKEGKTAVMAPDGSGRILGYVTSGRGGAEAFATRDADLTKARAALKAYRDDVAQNGERVFGADAIKRRNTLKAAADIAITQVSPLGKNEEAQKLESASIGSSGAYTWTGGNLDAVERKIKDLDDQQERYRRQGLIGYEATQSPEAAPASKPAAMQVNGTVYRLQPDGTYK